MSKRYTLITDSKDKPVIHYQAESIRTAKEKGDAYAADRKANVVCVVEGWTVPAGHIEEGGEIIKIGR